MSEAEALEAWSDEGEFADPVWQGEMEARRHRARRNARPATKRSRKPARPYGKPTMVRMLCHCGTEYEARKVDLLRGWGLSCSKSCAAIRRDYGRPAAKILGEVDYD